MAVYQPARPSFLQRQGGGESLAGLLSGQVQIVVDDQPRFISIFDDPLGHYLQPASLQRIAGLARYAASVEDGGNRAARRKYFSEAMAAMDPAVFPLLLGMYMGPETIPPEAVDESIVERVRAD